MNRNIRFITRTAILLAIAILFQFIGQYIPTYNNFIVGPVVNAVLLVATEFSGILSGVVISVIAPFVSAITNKSAMGPIVLAFSPFIISGNILLVLCYALLKKKNQIVAIGMGAVVKSAFLYGAILIFTSLMKLNDKITTVLLGLFSWPQLVTAILGGIIALAVFPALRKVIKEGPQTK